MSNYGDLTKLSRNQLLSLVNHGILKVMQPFSTQELTLDKTQLPEYQMFQHLRGIGISISAASRKYDVPHPTISRWVKKGLIAIIGHDLNRVLIDEADIAYCAEVRKDRIGQGKWLFAKDGTPYIPK
jgi:hypothetical protein